MKKQDIINEIKAAYERYKTIKPKDFNFRWFVSEYDEENKCGTICCLWGWEPKFGVLKDVKWSDPDMEVATYPDCYLSWGSEIIESLYYPDMGNGLTQDSPIEEVLSHWEKTIYTLETSTDLDHLLNLY